jgi:hypothetical protein
MFVLQRVTKGRGHGSQGQAWEGAMMSQQLSLPELWNTGMSETGPRRSTRAADRRWHEYTETVCRTVAEGRHQRCVFHALRNIKGYVFDAVRRLRREMTRRGQRGLKTNRVGAEIFSVCCCSPLFTGEKSRPRPSNGALQRRQQHPLNQKLHDFPTSCRDEREVSLLSYSS